MAEMVEMSLTSAKKDTCHMLTQVLRQGVLTLLNPPTSGLYPTLGLTPTAAQSISHPLLPGDAVP